MDGDLALRALTINDSSHLFFFAQLSVRNCFIRGSVIRYVQIPAKAPSPSARCPAPLFYVRPVQLMRVRVRWCVCVCVCGVNLQEVVTELLQDSARIEAREYKASQQ